MEYGSLFSLVPMVGFLLRIIGPAVYYKHNLFGGIYIMLPINCIREVMFIMRKAGLTSLSRKPSIDDPPYDERLIWEGKGDKMTQSYLLCVMNYNFAILDNAYLIHKSGIKSKIAFLKNLNVFKVASQTKLLKKEILPELKLLYGTRKGCHIT